MGKGKNGFEMKPGDMSVVYVCELPDIKGRFYPERAKEKGIKLGPEYHELQLGKSVFSKSLNILVGSKLLQSLLPAFFSCIKSSIYLGEIYLNWRGG